VQVINGGPTTGLDDHTQFAADEEATTSPPPLEVEIDLPKRKYRIGDPFSFIVTATRDCYFLVFTVSANDEVELHEPVGGLITARPGAPETGICRRSPALSSEWPI